MIDTHAHLNFVKFNQDYAEVIQRSFNNGVKKIINVSSNLATSQRAIEIAKKFDNCYAAIGLHPIYVKDEEFDLEKYYFLVRTNKRVIKAIGETGLDYTVFVREQAEVKDKSRFPQFIIQKQKEVFLKHLELSQKFNLPVILHCRGDKNNPKQAYKDLLDILRLHLNPRRNQHQSAPGVIHCFGANWSIAQQFLDLGFYVGFTGIITFPNATEDLLEVVAKTPLEKILIETDCPFLAPQPVRGQRCEPWHVKFTAEKIAEIKKMSFEEITRATTKNAIKLFKL